MSYVLTEEAVEPERVDGDTASSRLMATSERLEQRVTAYAPGRSRERRLDGKQEVLFVVAGRGAVEIDGVRHELEPGTGAYLAPGDTVVVDNAGPGELKVVSAEGSVSTLDVAAAAGLARAALRQLGCSWLDCSQWDRRRVS